MKKILIIEDDLGICNSLKLYLENSNFLVEMEADGSKALKKIKKVSPDLIILDLNLPGKDGIEITKEYRKTGKTPIVMLTARSSEIDRISGLEIGADDYIAKPFSPRELLARVNTILRRVDDLNNNLETEKNILKYKDIEINLEKKLAFKKGNNLSLTTNEFEILKKLLEKKGGVLTRESIMKEVMGYEKYIYDRTVDTHMKNLRKKLGKGDYILTIRGVGYRIEL